MTARDLATIALCVLGITYIVGAFLTMLSWFYVFPLQEAQGLMDTGLGSATLLGTTLIHAAVLGTLGLALLVNTKTLIRWLFPELQDGSLTTSGAELHRLAFAVVGVVIAASAVPHAVTAIFEVFWYLGGERRHLLADVIGNEWVRYSEAFLGVAAGAAIYQFSGWFANRLGHTDSRSSE